MHFRTACALCLIGWLVLLWAGCGGTSPFGAPPAIRKAAGEVCAHDADCKTRFCDRNTCVDLYDKRRYGGECAPRAPLDDADAGLDGAAAGPPDRGCGVGRLCLEGRCRSCTSDEECKSYFGMGKCRSRPGLDGLVCWPYPSSPWPIVHPSPVPSR
jgi:hypothetical protein